MLRFCATSLTALVMVVGGVTAAAASPILDPIVRTRGGGTGSYQIFSLPYFFDFGAFPTDPDTLPANIGLGDNCTVGTDIPSGLPMVSCEFQNLTGQTISLLDFQFSIPGDPTGLLFTTESVPDNLWNTLRAEQKLLLEALHGGGVGDEAGPDDLDGNVAIELAVVRLVDAAHPAFAEGVLDVVARAEIRAGLDDRPRGRAARGSGAGDARRRLLR
jgi:hypothetical protein